MIGGNTWLTGRCRSRWSSEPYLKRALGLAGDTLEMRNQRVYRNGSSLVEPYAVYTGSVIPSAATWGPLVVPKGQVFVMGVNRSNSSDSRYIGFIEEDSVVGRPIRVYFSWDPELGQVRWARMGHPF